MQHHGQFYTVSSEIPLAREQYDGSFLHSDVVAVDHGYCLLTYDHMLGRIDSQSRYQGQSRGNNSGSSKDSYKASSRDNKRDNDTTPAWRETQDSRYGERSVKGIFVCQSCRPHRVWTSSVISTEIWCSDATDKDALHDDLRNRKKSKGQRCSYRVLIHSQKCRECKRYVEPKIDVEDFSRKVIMALDLWMGNREVETDLEDDFHPTRPHVADLCHGCEIGVCRKGRRGSSSYHRRRRRSPI